MKETMIPENKVGCARIEHFIVDKHGSELSMLRREYVPEGKYTRLIVNGHIMMSNTPMEKGTNIDVIRFSHGKVLIAGLGIGMILTEILENEKVESVTVIEKYKDVIDLVAPSFNSPKLKIIHADIMEWKPDKGDYYDTIYFDIWPDICTDNLDEIKTLHLRARYWKNKSNPHVWVDSWMYAELKRQRYRDKRYSFAW
ncbi:MAG: rRNA adenine N-6-methyltransferase family protein [Clostridiaceae bacterium]